jgi:hypothetical protein
MLLASVAGVLHVLSSPLPFCLFRSFQLGAARAVFAAVALGFQQHGVCLVAVVR